MKKLIMLFVFAVFLCSTVVAAPISSPFFEDTSHTGDDFTGSVILGEESNEPEVEVLFPNKEIKSFEINQDGSFMVPAENLKIQGVYKLRFKDSDFQFPEHGWFRIFINRGINDYNEDFLNFIYSNADDSYCQPFNDSFTCKFGHYQASEINRFAKLYRKTNNESYNEKLFQLIDSNWTEGDASEYCEPRVNFNCSSIMDDDAIPVYEMNGSQRQGIIIKKLWEAYSYTNDNKIKELAINFSKGSAEECDVHNGEFDCGNSRDQGLMIQGYSKAYENSLNESYREILENLIEHSNIKKPHSELVKSFSLANPFIKTNLTNDIKNMTKSLLGTCSNCSDERLSAKQIMLIDAYQYEFSEIMGDGYANETLQYIIQRELFELFLSQNQDCGHTKSNYTCKNPFVQNRMVKLYYDLAFNFETFDHGFYDLQLEKASIHNNINLTIKFLGEIKEPRIFIKGDAFSVEDKFNNYTISRNGTFEIPSEYFERSTFIQLYFEDIETENRYPHYNYFMVPIPLETPGDIVKTEELILADPINYCGPFSSNDYACKYEYMQGSYMAGIGTALNLKFNRMAFNNLSRLSNEVIDPFLVYSTCDPMLDEYRCRLYTQDPLVLIQPGVFRAASLAEGYLESYKRNNELRLLKDAEILLSQTWNNCSLIESSFDCGEKNQGKLLSAVTLLYETTGDKRYHQWLESLIDESVSSGYKNTSTDVLGLLKAYPYSNETELKEFIEEGINETVEICKQDNLCEPLVYYNSLESAFLGYQLFSDHELFGLAQEIMASSPTSHLYCNPIEEHENYQCQYPNEQGEMLSSFAVLENNYVITDDTELNVTMEGETSGKFEDLLKINCTVENIDNVTLQSEDLYFQTEQSLINGSVTENIDGLQPDENITFNYTLNLTSGGRSSNICRILGFDDSLPLNVTDIGEILDVDYNMYVNEFTQNNLSINLTNRHDFLLEDLKIDFYPSFNISKITSNETNASDINTTLSREFFEAKDSIFKEYKFNNLTDTLKNISIESTSKFDGDSDYTVSFYTVNNSLPVDIAYDESPFIYDTDLFNLNVSNNKPFNLTQVSINAIATEGAAIDNATRIFNLTSNETKNFNFNITYNKSGLKNISFNVYASEGIDINPNVTLNVSSDIIDIKGEDQETGVNESFDFPVSVSNIGAINQTNITMNLEKTDDLVINNINLPEEFYYGSYMYNLTNSSLPYNFTQIRTNLSNKEKNVTINMTNNFNFSMLFNDTKNNRYIPKDSKLEINYWYNGTTPGEISLIENETLTDIDCRISENKSKTNCYLDPVLNETELFFIFNSTENESYQLTLFSAEIKNEFKYSYSFHSLINSSLKYNFSEVKSNLTNENKELGLNWTDTYNFSITVNDSLKEGHVFNESFLKVYYNYSGNYSGDIYVVDNKTKKETECSITNTTNKTLCKINPEKGVFDIFFNFNSTGNLTVSKFELENTVKNPKNRTRTNNDLIELDYLEPDDSILFKPESTIGSDNQELVVDAFSAENGTGSLVIEIEEDERTPREDKSQSKSEDEDSSPPPPPPSKEEILYWDYEELHTFKNLSDEKSELELYFNNSYSSGIDFNKTLSQIDCFNVTRNFNITSNKTSLNIKNNCSFTIKNFYFYERLEEKNIFNLTTNITKELSNKTLFNKELINPNETFTLNYTVQNVSIEKIETIYENFSIHVQEKDGPEEPEKEPEKKYKKWEYSLLKTFEKPIEYDGGLRENFELKETGNFSYNKTLNNRHCLVANRTYENHSNIIWFSITNLCDFDINDLFIYENVSMDLISNLSHENYSGLEEGFLLHTPFIGANTTLKINYTISNLSLNEIDIVYNKSFIHIKEPYKKPPEPFFNIDIEKEHLFFILLIGLLSFYIVLIRYKIVSNPLKYLDPSWFFIYINKKIKKLKKIKIVPDFVKVRIAKIKRKWSYFKLKYLGKYPVKALLFFKKNIYNIKNTKFFPRWKSPKVTSIERNLMDINLKLKYASKLYERKNYKECENLLNGIPLLILTAVDEEGDKYTQKDKEKIDFLLKRASSIYTNVQLNKHNEYSPFKKKNKHKKSETKKIKSENEIKQKEKKQMSVKGRIEKKLMDINLKLKHAENFYLSGNYQESEKLLCEVPTDILSAMETTKGKYNDDMRKKISFLLDKASNVYNQIQQIKIDKMSSTSKIKNKAEDDSDIEVNLYTKLLKIKQLNEKKDLDRASEEIKRVRSGIENLDVYEKKKERLMLLKKLKEYEKVNKNMRNTTLTYKLKRIFRFQDRN
ncbi:MAG: hypothetical protein ACOCQG_00445 [Candidatus Nanoarchaeia archaeon]